VETTPRSIMYGSRKARTFTSTLLDVERLKHIPFVKSYFIFKLNIIERFVVIWKACLLRHIDTWC
jgi:hypothetical protein